MSKTEADNLKTIALKLSLGMGTYIVRLHYLQARVFASTVRERKERLGLRSVIHCQY
ncbi:hypothetical protein X777_07089 [Ooceraea biroi]|uniref:Uncharacterized protein n=1 Tax=Ooceraea biroi TaxID=2015173 RepID=A0A026W9S4_OOCBI|nr:hypothetical protein X777_07089 [Ooceraea biroi]